MKRFAYAIAVIVQLGGPTMAMERLATPQNLPVILGNVQAGDVVRLAAGFYGDVRVSAKSSGLVRIVSDPTAPAVFNSLLVRGAEGIQFEGLRVAFTPNLNTRESQNVVFVDGSARITFLRGKITSGPAINGIPETATVGDASGNVKGWPLGRGFYVQLSSDVEISESEIWGVQRGLLTYKSSNVRMLRNDVHDVRRTFILGDASDLRIDGNRLHGSKPWRWGQTPIGDHGDCIALFPSSLGPMSRVSITNNSCIQNPGGTAILGFTLAGIRDLKVIGNRMQGTDHQGIVTTDVQDAIISDNVLLGRAGILLRDPTNRVSVVNNVSAYVEDRLKGKTGNVVKSRDKSPRVPKN